MEQDSENEVTVAERGDLKWAKLSGHPWWPGIVSNCPETLTHVKGEKGNTQVHIHFYINPPSRAWIKTKQVRPFLGREDPECKKGGLYHSNKKTLSSALTQAENAQFMTVEERLDAMTKDGRGNKRKRLEEAEIASASASPKKRVMRAEAPVPAPNKRLHGPKSAAKAQLKRLTGPKSKQIRGKPGPKSKTRPVSNNKDSYKHNEKSIPKHWKSAFVLMNTNDIPEDLTPTGCVVLNKGSPRKTNRPVEAEDEEEDEERMDDSDGDPGWSPGGKGSDEDAAGDDSEAHSEEEEEVHDSEEDLSDSDEDPGWRPGGAKPIEAPKKTKKFGFKKKGGSKGSSTVAKPSTSLKSSEACSSVTSKKAAGGGKGSSKGGSATGKGSGKEAASSSKTSSSGTPPDSTGAGQNKQVVKDNTPTGPEPDVGDFFYEKEECKDGDIPFLWRYKKSGLIQKYERVVESDRTMYESLLNYSDWWNSYAHKFEKVKVQVVYKYRNKEKVAIIESDSSNKDKQPLSNSISPTAKKSTTKSPRSDKKAASDTKAASSKKASAPKASKAPEQTQEQEISSTTPDPDFQVGNFVLDMKDQRNVDNFPIWKIESTILLKKFESIIKNGKVLHKAAKTYRGYKDIAKSYVSIKVKKVDNNDDLVEVKDDSKPKLDVDSNMEEAYDKNPLLRHFYVYLQVFLSQALEPGFLDEINKTSDSTYTFPLGEIDKLIKQKTTNIERKARWTGKIKNAVMKCPYLREVPKPDEKKTCEAVTDSTDKVLKTVFLFGSEYDVDTLKQSGNSHPCQEFRIGETAITYISTYHQLCHFKYNLYDKCLAKIKIIRETASGEMDVTKIMDSCLGNKAWVLQNFEDFMKLVELS